jgi:hypothetical protein
VCLRCFNQPEDQPDDTALRKAIELGEYGDIAVLAAEHDLTVEELEAWIVRNECGRASDRLLQAFRGDLRLPPQFSVSFVSGLAGVLLAAELLKDHYATDVPLDDANVRFVFQFLDPFARTNRTGRYLPEPDCPMCGAGANPVALEQWQQRSRVLAPARSARTT